MRFELADFGDKHGVMIWVSGRELKREIGERTMRGLFGWLESGLISY